MEAVQLDDTLAEVKRSPPEQTVACPVKDCTNPVYYGILTHLNNFHRGAKLSQDALDRFALSRCKTCPLFRDSQKHVCVIATLLDEPLAEPTPSARTPPTHELETPSQLPPLPQDDPPTQATSSSNETVTPTVSVRFSGGIAHDTHPTPGAVRGTW